MGRLENVSRLWAGKPITDNYSAYGPYGRHNREYMPNEIGQLLIRLGFEVKQLFTSDIGPHIITEGLFSEPLMNLLLEQRQDNLGNIFLHKPLMYARQTLSGPSGYIAVIQMEVSRLSG